MDKREKILNGITVIFRKELKDESLELNYQSSADSVEKWDSISNVMLFTAIEEKFEVIFPVEFIFTAENVGDLCDFILNNSAVV